MGVDNEKALELTNSTVFHRGRPSIRDGVLCSGMHHRDSKIFFHPAKFDNFRDEIILDFKTVSVSQSESLRD